MACDRREVTGAPLRSPALRERERSETPAAVTRLVATTLPSDMLREILMAV